MEKDIEKKYTKGRTFMALVTVIGTNKNGAVKVKFMHGGGRKKFSKGYSNKHLIPVN